MDAMVRYSTNETTVLLEVALGNAGEAWLKEWREAEYRADATLAARLAEERLDRERERAHMAGLVADALARIGTKPGPPVVVAGAEARPEVRAVRQQAKEMRERIRAHILENAPHASKADVDAEVARLFADVGADFNLGAGVG